MKICFVIPYPYGASPSQRFRFEQYHDILIKAGHQPEYFSFWSEKGWSVLYMKGSYLSKLIELIKGFLRRCRLMFVLGRYDIVFIHREASPIGPPIFEWLIASIFKKKIVFDFDDAIWLPNTSDENRLISWLKFNEKTGYTCRSATVVSCGNAYLADYASKSGAKNVVVNPTTIDPEHHTKLATGQEHSSLVIGWTGSHSTLPYLQLVEEALRQIAKANPQVRVVVIADRAPALDIPNLSFVKWRKETEIEDLQLLDVGIMPLTDDEWSRGKCGFKALQYMALSIPVVASPVGVNTEIVAGGCGLLATTTNDWVHAVQQLIDDPSLRKKMGEAGRARVMARYSTTSNSGNFLSLFRP